MKRSAMKLGLELGVAQDITGNVEPTWSHCSRIGDNPGVRLFLPLMGEHTRRFVRSFPLMKQAYAQGAMAFGLFVARKPVFTNRGCDHTRKR